MRAKRPGAVPPPIPPEALRPRLGPEATTEALVEAARVGDARAFGHLVRRYRPRILALGLHLTGSRSDAEDVAQDAFLRAFQALPEFEGRSAFFTWVYRIAVNRALQLRAGRRAQPRADLDDPRVALAVAVDAAAAPGRALELRETYAQLVAAFDALSPLLRTTVALVTLQGLSHPEVAAVMDSTEGTIAWRMHEARAQLRRALGATRAERLAEARATPVPTTRRGSEGSSSDSLTFRLAFALAAAL